MSNKVQLEVTSPCQQSWETMKPRPDGRFCDACSKSVIDLTLMSDAELLRFFRNKPANICGRLHPDQLNRTLFQPRRSWTGLRYFLTVSIPAFLLSIKQTSAQTVPAPVEQRPLHQQSSDTTVLDPIEVRSRVTDDQGAPIPFATITETGTSNSVTANADGNFTIRILPSSSLTLSATGFTMVRLNAAGARSACVLRSSAMILGEVVTVTYGKLSRREIRRAKKAARRREREATEAAKD